MGLAVIDYVDDWVSVQKEQLMQRHISTHQLTQEFFDSLLDFYAQGRKACVLASMINSTARGTLQNRLSQSFRHWLELIEVLLQKAGYQSTQIKQLSLDLAMEIEGALILAAGLNDSSIFQKKIQRIQKRLLELPNSTSNICVTNF